MNVIFGEGSTRAISVFLLNPVSGLLAPEFAGLDLAHFSVAGVGRIADEEHALDPLADTELTQEYADEIIAEIGGRLGMEVAALHGDDLVEALLPYLTKVSLPDFAAPAEVGTDFLDTFFANIVFIPATGQSVPRFPSPAVESTAARSVSSEVQATRTDKTSEPVSSQSGAPVDNSPNIASPITTSGSTTVVDGLNVFYGDDYTTAIHDLVFTSSGGQFCPSVTGFAYSRFFGVGEDDLVGDTFRLGGPLSVDIPFEGETEIFRAEIFGEIGAQFGLHVDASLDPGSVDAVLP